MAGTHDTQIASEVADVTGNQGLRELRTRIREHSDGFSPAAQAVCRSLVEIKPEQLLYMSAVELGAQTRTSNATVIRTLQSLGYSGLAELKGAVAGPFTTATPPAVRTRQRVESIGGDLQKLWDKVTDESIERIELLRRSFSLDRFKHAVELMIGAREVIAYGVGASSVVAERLSLKLRRMGRRASCINSSGFRLADDLLKIERDDVVVLFDAGRLLVDVEVLLDRARVVGASCILVTDELEEQLKDSVSVVLHAPQTPTGLSGETVTAMVLADALAQGVATSDIERTVEVSYTLTTLRQQLGF
jgi:DNA-binding MurR/RpiR family transcriptional regulator